MPKIGLKEGYIAVRDDCSTGICNNPEDAELVYQTEVGGDEDEMVIYKVIARYKKKSKFESDWP